MFSTFRKIKLVFFISIALIFLKICLFDENKQQNTAVAIDRFWVRKTHLKTKFNIVVGGDSRIYRGVSIDDLKKGLKTDKYTGINLGYSGAGFSDGYMDFLLSRLDNSRKKKIIILGLTPHSLTHVAADNEAYYQYKNYSSFEKFKLLYLFEVFKYFSPYKPLSLLRKEKPDDAKDVFLEDYTESGWVATKKTIDSTFALDKYKKVFETNKVSAKVVNQLLEKVKKIREAGIIVIVFRPPTTNQMVNLENSLGGFNESYIRSELEKLGVHWIEFKDTNFLSYDGSHLNLEAAKKLSYILGHKLNEIIELKY